VVAAPERDALREAAYFVERLAAERMPLAGLVLNRVHGSGAAQLSAERALAAAENLEDARIVDQRDGKESPRNSPETHGSSKSTGSSDDPAAASDEGSPAGGEDGGALDHLTAGLLRLHAERMRLLSREQRTRDRFLALHPEVAVAEVAALPGDVHDLTGLREIGDRLAADAEPS
jgi:anion-transporting  ArsA/GET3 family ATPase